MLSDYAAPDYTVTNQDRSDIRANSRGMQIRRDSYASRGGLSVALIAPSREPNLEAAGGVTNAQSHRVPYFLFFFVAVSAFLIFFFALYSHSCDATTCRSFIRLLRED